MDEPLTREHAAQKRRAPAIMKCFFLHGFTQNGAVLSAHARPLLSRLPAQLDCEFPSAPHTCSEASLARLRSLLGVVQEPPHLCWWNATDDGRMYRGWEDSLAHLRAAVSESEPFGVLGFSQGAIVAAALAALAQRGEFPELRFVAVVAGRTPRADALKPLFDAVLPVPSLHVWGARDAMAREDAPKLVEKFDPATREVVRWDGPHVLPTFGPAADAIVSFLRKHACV